MRKIVISSILFLGLAFSSNLRFGPETVYGSGSNSTEVISSTPAGVTLRVSTNKLVLQDVNIEGESFIRVSIPGGGFTANVGLPEIPTIPIKLAVPRGAEIRIQYTTGNYEEVHGIDLFPAQEALPETPQGNEEVNFTRNDDFYRENTWYPEKPVSHTPVYTIRGVNITSLIVAPVQYNPATKTLRIYRNLDIRVSFVGGGKFFERRLISPYFYNVFKKLLANSNLIPPPVEYSGKSAGADILYFVPDSLYDSLRPLVEWRELSGMQAKVVKLSELGPNPTANQIRNYILNAYNSWSPAPTFVSIVGDAELIPTHYRFHHPYTNEWIGTDIYYAEMDSNSYIPFPDLFVGRISVDNSQQLGVYVRKILRYETDPFTDVNWFNRILLAAYDESGRYFVATSESAYVYLNSHGYEVIRQYEDGNPPGSTSGVIQAINGGVAIVNHRDHGASRNGGGTTEGWAHPRFTVNELPQLTNTYMTPVFFSPNCESGWFDGETDEYSSRSYESIGEELIRMQDRGAIGYIGATRISYSGYNDELDKGFWDALFPDFHPGYPDSNSINPYNTRIPQPGGILAYGKYWMYDRYVLTNGQGYPWSPDSEKTRTEFEEFNYVGEPATSIRTAMPQELTVQYPATVPIGQSVVTVTVLAGGTPVEGAVVVLKQDTSLYVKGITDATGQVALNITVLTPDSIQLAVSGYNLIPFTSGIQPISSGPYVAAYKSAVDDDTLGQSSGNGDGIINPGETVEISFKFKNWGMDTATALSFRVSGDSSVTVLDTSSHPLQDLGPGDSTVFSAIPVYVHTELGNGTTFQLNIWVMSDSGDTWNSSVVCLVGTPVFAFEDFIINDSSSSQHNGRLDPGESAFFKFDIANTGLGIAYSPYAVLYSEDTFLTIPDDTLHFPTIMPDSVSTSTDSILISASPATLREHSATIFMEVRTVDGYIDTLSFDIVVGQITSEDPVGPDNYGYYAYDITDRYYSERPEFNWIEINNSGVRLSLGDDDAQLIRLPSGFTFRYYGSTFSSISVCSNGFVAPGSISSHPFSNRPLPHSDGIKMIAPFWDDLRPATGGGTGFVYYLVDTVNHYLVVEFDSVGHYAHSSQREKFEVVIYDASYYPTPTGDSPILFQYLKVANSSSMTTGIENLSENDGLQYVYNGTYHRAAAPLSDSFAIKFTTASPLSVNETPSPSVNKPIFAGVFPNIIRNHGTIRFTIPSKAHVEISVFDVTGRKVKQVLNKDLGAGTHSYRWNVKGDRGLKPGVYFIQLKVNDGFKGVKKVILVR